MKIGDAQADVRKFMLAAEQTLNDVPGPVSVEVMEQRKQFFLSEAKELIDAMVASDLPEIYDGILDCIYVLLGTAESYGMDLEPGWEAVHNANMAKMPPVLVNGKVQKPAGWKHPDMGALLRKQGWGAL